jgi:hypothetical protein
MKAAMFLILFLVALSADYNAREAHRHIHEVLDKCTPGKEGS